MKRHVYDYALRNGCQRFEREALHSKHFVKFAVSDPRYFSGNALALAFADKHH
jgi:hypothetical protein